MLKALLRVWKKSSLRIHTKKSVEILYLCLLGRVEHWRQIDGKKNSERLGRVEHSQIGTADR